MERVNHLAVLVSAVVMFALGYLWYSVIFHATYVAALGLGAAPAPMPPPTMLIEMFVLGWILSYFAAMAIAKAPNAGAMSASDGIMFGAFTGIGFFAVPYLLIILAEGRPFSLWAINAGYVTVALIVTGAILTSWKKPAIAV